MSKPEKCQACGERVICQEILCGPCWRLRAIALADQLAAQRVPEYEVF